METGCVYKTTSDNLSIPMDLREELKNVLKNVVFYRKIIQNKGIIHKGLKQLEISMQSNPKNADISTGVGNI